MEMKPEVKTTNVAQVLITFALLGILVSILALYIYYGMYQARQITPVVEITPEAMPVITIEDSRQKELIEALSRQPIEADPEQTRKIINSLSQNPVEPDSVETEQKRAEIIKALQQN